MKKILLCGVLLTLITLQSSCDGEELTYTSHQQLKRTSTFPLDSQNPYDEIGELHNLLFENYLTSANTANTIEDIAIEVNYLMVNHSNLKPTTIPIDSLFSVWVEQMLNDPQNSLDKTISDTGLSIKIKTKLNDLIGLASGVTTNDFHQTLQAIISYEEAVITDETFTPEEKQLLLTIATIVKYSLYDNGDRKDKDWDLSVGNIVATAYGATHSCEDALLMALTTKIFQENQLVNP